MSRLRGFQTAVKYKAYEAWRAGARVVMPVMPTGAGKTVLMGDVAMEFAGYGCAIAHRSELVGQISVALAREGIRHDLITSKPVVRSIVAGHMENVGRSFYDPSAKWKVASVDTIIRRSGNDSWYNQVGMVFQDEGHHVLRDNKWGRAFSMFPNALGFFPTATPVRADGRGLGSHHDGLVDVMVEGPSMRWLIDNGFLTDYRIRAPTTEDLDLTDDDISESTGDFNKEKVRRKVKASQKIIGDVVETYCKHARGLLGITFAVDVEHATEICKAYNDASVPAAIVTAETPEEERRKLLRMFRNRELLQLVNVDLFGEGFDLPAIQCVSMARPTASFGLYAQQFGRALRLMVSDVLQAAWDTYTPEQRKRFIAESDKPTAFIFDHVGNVIRHHGAPDRPREWSLDRRDRRKRTSDGIPLRVCLNLTCQQPYERIYPACPYCGEAPPPPQGVTRPEQVDGDLTEYTPEMLAALAGDINKVDGPCYPPPDVAADVAGAIRRRHAERQQAQHALRQAMFLVMPPCVDERVNNRKFFLTYGIDTLAAKALGSTDAGKLRERIAKTWTSLPES